MNWKKALWPLTALLAFLAFLFKGQGPWKDRAKQARVEASKAQVDAIEAKADLDKEKIKHDTEQAVDFRWSRLRPMNHSYP